MENPKPQLVIERIKSYWNLVLTWFWTLPVWKRVVFSSIIGAFGGSSIVGFFNKYALYYHAFRQGFRIPVEGVEYVSLAVSLLSFAFIITSIIGTISIYYILNLLAYSFTNIFASAASEELKEKITKRVMVLQIILGGIGSFLGFTVKFWSIEIRKIEMAEVQPSLLAFLTVIFTVLFIGFILKSNDNHRKIFTLSVVFTGVLVITLSLFNQNVYKSFLKSIKYGGEIPVRIEYRKADDTATLISGNLLLKTNSTITLRNLVLGNVEEIPFERVSKITYLEN